MAATDCSMPVCLCVCMSVSMFVCVCVSVCLSMYVCTCSRAVTWTTYYWPMIIDRLIAYLIFQLMLVKNQ